MFWLLLRDFPTYADNSSYLVDGYSLRVKFLLGLDCSAHINIST